MTCESFEIECNEPNKTGKAPGQVRDPLLQKWILGFDSLIDCQ